MKWSAKVFKLQRTEKDVNWTYLEQTMNAQWTSSRKTMGVKDMSETLSADHKQWNYLNDMTPEMGHP